MRKGSASFQVMYEEGADKSAIGHEGLIGCGREGL